MSLSGPPGSHITWFPVGRPGFGGVVGVVTGWSLRTAQWTRASLILCSTALPLSSFGRWWWARDARVRVLVGLCVAKMLRAHGGCLGTRSR